MVVLLILQNESSPQGFVSLQVMTTSSAREWRESSSSSSSRINNKCMIDVFSVTGCSSSLMLEMLRYHLSVSLCLSPQRDEAGSW